MALAAVVLALEAEPTATVLEDGRVGRHGAWDHCLINSLANKVLVSETSYVHHFPDGGVHADTSDVAVNPTGYLQRQN